MLKGVAKPIQYSYIIKKPIPGLTVASKRIGTNTILCYL